MAGLPSSPVPAADDPEPAAPTRDGGLIRVRLDIAYDGAGFSGWAAQPGRRTVQGELTSALSTLLRCQIELTVAGRTDAGVHATGQVAHADLPAQTDLEWLAGRLARLLPADVRVPAVRPAPAGFDARFSALRRHYAYRVADQPWGVTPLRRFDTLSWPRRLDERLLTEAALALCGEHDFVAFCRRREGASTVRELQRFAWQREPDGVLVAEVSADAFCHNMVRSLVGALLAVGAGQRPVGWPASLLIATERSSSVSVAPAHGLTLVGVDYPPDDELAARAATTRQRRTKETGRISHQY